MAEIAKFLASVEDKAPNTIKQYNAQYNKLFALIGKNIGETSEKKLIDIISDTVNINAKQALINIAIQVRRLDELSVAKLVSEREKNKHKLIGVVKNTNLKLQNSLPSYEELINYMDSLYEASAWTDYIINYLLIYHQVRNLDLLFDIVTRKKDMSADGHIFLSKNYLWLSPKKVVYTRNSYKTADTHGQKVTTITDPKFITAVKRVFACQKHNETCGVFIPNSNQLGYYILNATYKQLGEGKIMKIVVNHFRHDLNKIKQIAASRGTSFDVILSNYDIDNV